MKKKIIVFIALFVPFALGAVERAKVEVAAGADLVSSYVWRGVYQTAFAVQPGLSLSCGGVSLGVWGSTDLSSLAKEFDVALSYEKNGFGVAFTDYWWAGEGNPYGHYAASHMFEGSLGYTLSGSLPITFLWNTMIGLDGDKDEEGARQYSTYVSAGYAFSVNDVALSVTIGVSPWTGIYHRAGTEGFALSTVSLKAAREIRITDAFTLPIFVETIIAPNQDNVFLVAGVSF
ncbi:MAG: hypothetical protein LBI58_04575 [Tannerellaceae bacterium]|nr:hypothetical protein [Tannerellaceae bacterium]